MLLGQNEEGTGKRSKPRQWGGWQGELAGGWEQLSRYGLRVSGSRWVRVGFGKSYDKNEEGMGWNRVGLRVLWLKLWTVKWQHVNPLWATGSTLTRDRSFPRSKPNSTLVLSCFKYVWLLLSSLLGISSLLQFPMEGVSCQTCSP